MTRMFVASCIIIGGGGLFLTGCLAVRGGYESAPYTVIHADGKFEIRDYPELSIVETPMVTVDGSDGSFSRLFRFITGANDANQKISMTTPVFMSADSSSRRMAFVLPATMDAAAVPRPADGAVAVRILPAGRFAVLRFSGGRSTSHETEALGQLQERIGQEQLSATSGPMYAYFDPPWTPAFLRRNEVMLRIEDKPL